MGHFPCYNLRVQSIGYMVLALWQTLHAGGILVRICQIRHAGIFSFQFNQKILIERVT
jgi:hypothetical protein